MNTVYKEQPIKNVDSILISKVCYNCIHHIRQYIIRNACKTLAHAWITIQWVTVMLFFMTVQSYYIHTQQNSVVWLVISKWEHITPVVNLMKVIIILDTISVRWSMSPILILLSLNVLILTYQKKNSCLYLL